MIRRTPLFVAAFISPLVSVPAAACTYDKTMGMWMPHGCKPTSQRVSAQVPIVALPSAAADHVALDEARRLARKEFDELLASGEARSEWIVRRVNEIKVDFLGRLARHSPDEEFSRTEVEHISDMLDAQLDYGRELRKILKEADIPEADKRSLIGRLRARPDADAVLKDPRLPPEVRAAIDNAIKEINKRMEQYHNPKGRSIMPELHNSINVVFAKDYSGWPRPGRPLPGGSRPDGGGGDSGDEIIMPSPPSSHGDYMKDKFGRDPAVWESAARDKLFKGDVAGGLADLNGAISLGGGADSYALRGAIRLDKGDYAGAYADAKKALALNANDNNAMGILKSAEGRVADGALRSDGRASSFYRVGASQGSRTAGMTHAAMLASGTLLEDGKRAWSLGDYQRAIALANRALDINPRNAAAHNLLAMIHARMRNYPMAIASAGAGLALAPGSVKLLNNKAFAENRAKRYKDALAAANRAIESDARNALAYANRAHAYGGLGERDAMLADINRAASLDQRFKQAAEGAAMLQLPSDQDILFLFPGEASAAAAAAPGGAKSRKSFGLVVGSAVLGGLLLALGLLSSVLAPLRDSVVSVFRRATRRGPCVGALPVAKPAEMGVDRARILRGQYEFVRRIGSGGMGTVYECTDRLLGRRVAIKKMRDELCVNLRECERFVIEARTVASLHHPNIVDIYTIVEENDDVYLVFEFIDGLTIHDLLQTRGRFNPAEALRVSRAVAEALGYAHSRGVIHRDLKPSNVMLDASGKVLVMDFGIARMAKDALTRYSMTNTVVGTPPYMAPEQEQGVVRKESDVYSLAICAYEMLTGKLPFIGIGAGMLMNKINMSYVPPSRRVAGLPESFDEVFAKAFSADPERRYRTPQDFAAAFEAAAGGVRSSAQSA